MIILGLWGPSIYELLVILFIFIFVTGVFGSTFIVIPFWKICSKVGFPGPLSLLMLVPIANIILPFYIAFAEWPAFKQNP